MTGIIEFFLVHPGGPFYAKKNEGVWSIPKGIVNENEDLLAAAKREFLEETGIQPSGTFHSLKSIRLKSGKEVHAWSFLGNWNESMEIISNTFPMEWPPRSGKIIEVPEIDRAAWMKFDYACKMIHQAQRPFLERAINLYQNSV